MARVKRKEYIEYEEALSTFTTWRKELNDCIDLQPESFTDMFNAVKYMAGKGNPIAMDVLAYYYKSGVPKLLKENYMTYMKWEILAAAWGNELAIEKLQFLIGYACDEIINHDDFSIIKYKNDIDDYNVLYVTGKAICKMLIKHSFKINSVDLYQEKDEHKPYTQEMYINIRKMIDDAVPKAIEYLKS